MASLRKHRLTPEEYLTIERAADQKSEYLSGEMFAMAGASRQHIRIVINLGSEFKSALQGQECEGYSSDLRVKVTDTAYTYPDLVVVCGEMIYVDDKFDTLTNPTVIFEVLSDSTEAYDRGEKFALYRRIESLRQYVLISQDKPRVEWFTLLPDGQWVFGEANGLEVEVKLSTIACDIPMAEIYDRVTFGGAEGAVAE